MRSTRSSSKRGGRPRRSAGAAEDEPPQCQHVSFHEAEAYARWAGKRLPTEPEWEKAVKTVGAELEHAQGAVWQWTSSFFDGYPGFSGLSVQGVLRGFLRRRVPGAARRLLGHRSARRPAHLSQLGSAAAAADLRRHPVRAMLEWLSGLDVLRDEAASPTLYEATRRSLQARAKGAAAGLALRRARVAAVRGDHPAPRVLPAAPRRRDPAARARPRSPAQTEARTLDRARLRDARNTRLLLDALDCRHARALRSPRRERADAASERRRDRGGVSARSPSSRSSVTSSTI